MTQAPTTPPHNPEQNNDGHELRMGLFEHLAELRDRLLKAMLALVVGTVIGFALADFSMGILQGPFCEITQNAEECRFQILEPTGNVIVYFRVSLLVGGILSIPVVTYQLLMFVLPGLTKRERRMVLMAIPAITGLFLIGVLFAWFVLTPTALNFLSSFWETRTYTEWTADGYLSFVTALVFWMGVAFETPLIFFVLSLIGIVNAQALRQNWRVAVVGSAVAAAFITPTIDPVNMFLVMGPLLALYVMSIGLVAIGTRISGTG
jgi:sec-independent protein translocase protein TatC